MPPSDSAKILEDVDLPEDGTTDEALSHSEHSLHKESPNPQQAKRVRKLWKWNLEGMTLVVLSVIVLSFSITVALVICIFLGDPQVKPHAVVASESELCTAYGLALLKSRRGNAVDAAVATALCIAVARPDKASLAGCGLMLVRDRNLRENQLYDFMCPAPSNPQPLVMAKPETTVGVPGFIRGLHAAHSKFGQNSWSDLFKDAIKIASEGFQPGSALLAAATTASSLNKSSVIVDELINLPSGIYKPPVDLRHTLLSLAKYGPDYFYRKGSASETFADQLITHMASNGQNWFASDLTDYVVQQPKPIQMGFAGFMLEAFPSPSSAGPYLLSLLGNLDLKNTQSPLDPFALARNDANATGTLLHRLIELAHSAEYGVSMLGDPYDEKIAADVLSAQNNLLSPDVRNSLVETVSDVTTSTVHIPPQRQVLDIGDTGILVSDSVHLTVIINIFLGTPFGSGTMVPNTGIHLNSALRLFPSSGPTSGLNVLADGRRPLAPVSPVYISAIHRKCGIRAGLVNTGGYWGAMDSAQVIANAALFLNGITCRPPADTSHVAYTESVAQSKRSPPTLNQGSYTPAADYGCINPQAAIDLARIHSYNSGPDTSPMPVQFEPVVSEELVDGLANLGHLMRSYTDSWPGRVVLAGWNGYSMISSVDKRGSWRLETY